MLTRGTNKVKGLEETWNRPSLLGLKHGHPKWVQSFGGVFDLQHELTRTRVVHVVSLSTKVTNKVVSNQLIIATTFTKRVTALLLCVVRSGTVGNGAYPQ